MVEARIVEEDGSDLVVRGEGPGIAGSGQGCFCAAGVDAEGIGEHGRGCPEDPGEGGAGTLDLGHEVRGIPGPGLVGHRVMVIAVSPYAAAGLGEGAQFVGRQGVADVAEDDSGIDEEVGLYASGLEDPLEGRIDAMVAVVDRDDDVGLALDPPGDRVVQAHEAVAHRPDLVELVGELLFSIVDARFAAAQEGMVVEDDDRAFGGEGRDQA